MTDISERIKELIDAGFALCRIKAGEKLPTGAGWPLNPIGNPHAWRQGDGVGIIAGPLSNGVVTVDCDFASVDADAWAAADELLPPTPCMDGRAGKLKAHRHYRLTNTTWTDDQLPLSGLVREAMNDGRLARFCGIRHFSDGDGRCVDFIGAGGQCVVPPSPHHSGVNREWHGGALAVPALIDYATLFAAVKALSERLGMHGRKETPPAPPVDRAVLDRIPSDHRLRRLVEYLRAAPALRHRAGEGYHAQQYRICMTACEFGVEYADALQAVVAWDSMSATPDGEQVMADTLSRAYERGAFGSKVTERTGPIEAAARVVAAPSAMPGVGIFDLMKVDPENDPNALLGERRWFCRGNIGILYGESGLGKSSLLAQLLIGWSLGSTVLGIRPMRPVRSLLVQAENDLGDLSEMLRGVTMGMDITEQKDLEVINASVRIMTEACVSGADKVMAYLRPLMDGFRPDLLVIDPLFAFLGGNASDQEVASPFIRNMLMPLAAEYGCAILLVHHTNKPGANGRQASFAGSQEWENAARMTMSLHSRDGGGATLEARKRGPRLGWVDAAGERTTKKSIRYSSEFITWLEDRSPADEVVSSDRELVLLRHLAGHPGRHSIPKLSKTLAKALGAEGQSTIERLLGTLRRKGLLEPGSYVVTPAGTALVDDTNPFVSPSQDPPAVPRGGTGVPSTWDGDGTHGENQASQWDGGSENPRSVPASHHPKGGDVGRGTECRRRTVAL